MYYTNYQNNLCDNFCAKSYYRTLFKAMLQLVVTGLFLNNRNLQDALYNKQKTKN